MFTAINSCDQLRFNVHLTLCNQSDHRCGRERAFPLRHDPPQCGLTPRPQSVEIFLQDHKWITYSISFLDVNNALDHWKKQMYLILVFKTTIKYIHR